MILDVCNSIHAWQLPLHSYNHWTPARKSRNSHPGHPWPLNGLNRFAMLPLQKALNKGEYWLIMVDQGLIIAEWWLIIMDFCCNLCFRCRTICKNDPVERFNAILIMIILFYNIIQIRIPIIFIVPIHICSIPIYSNELQAQPDYGIGFTTFLHHHIRIWYDRTHP